MKSLSNHGQQIADALQVFKHVAEYAREIERERTEQVRLREDARAEVERVHAMRDLLMDYLDRSFDERRENFKQLFARLDGAIAANNVQMAAVVLDTVVKLADASPFKALQDVAATRAALHAKDKEWKF